jgi:hypothetical protein
VGQRFPCCAGLESRRAAAAHYRTPHLSQPTAGMPVRTDQDRKTPTWEVELAGRRGAPGTTWFTSALGAGESAESGAQPAPRREPRPARVVSPPYPVSGRRPMRRKSSRRTDFYRSRRRPSTGPRPRSTRPDVDLHRFSTSLTLKPTQAPPKSGQLPPLRPKTIRSARRKPF